MDRIGEPFARGHRVSVDWMLVAITLLAAALMVATTLRTDSGAAGSRLSAAGGLSVLSTDQHLVAFEDFSFGAQGWSGAAAEGTNSAPGMLFGSGESDGAKRFSLPADAARVQIAFDLRLSDGWSGEGLIISVNGTPVIDSLQPSNAARIRRVSRAQNAWFVRLDVPARDAVTLTVASHGTQDTHWGIDNVLVVATPGAPTS